MLTVRSEIGPYQKPPGDFTEKSPTRPKRRLLGKRGCASQLLFIPGWIEHEYPGKACLFWVRHEHILRCKPLKSQILQPTHYQEHATSVHGEDDDEHEARKKTDNYFFKFCDKPLTPIPRARTAVRHSQFANTHWQGSCHRLVWRPLPTAHEAGPWWPRAFQRLRSLTNFIKESWGRSDRSEAWTESASM